MRGAAAGYVVAEGDFDDDDQALVAAVDDDALNRRGKLGEGDNTPTEIRRALKSEIAAQKAALGAKPAAVTKG